ncbi:MAG: hypothetical protein ABFS02_13445 [Pseudomonadota bacterium]
MNDDYDSPWKDVLERYFQEFMVFFFPRAAADIDWGKGYESLDTELRQVVRDAETGKRFADKLMKVWRGDGQAQLVLIHIEVQGDFDKAFAERMFVYHYRLYDRFRQPIVSLGVLGDDSNTWRPERYRTELWGCETLLRFPTVKLVDYDSRWEELEASSNPFAVMVMAHLKTRATRKDSESRLRWKLSLVKGLYEKGYSREDVLELSRFIDWLLVLPDGLSQRFQDQLKDYEATMGTPYITSIERSGIAKGIQQGIERGIEQGIEQGLERGLVAERALLRRLTQRRFGEVCAGQLEELLQSVDDPERLAEVGEWIIDCETGEAFLARVRAGQSDA